MKEQSDTCSVHNIGVVERRTGIKADLVRAWERRYRAVVPERTSSQRRLYSDADIRRLVLLRDAIRLGHRIGHIAALADADLEALLEHPEGTGERGVRAERRLEIEDRIDSCLRSVEALDSPGLNAQLERACFDLGRIALVEDLLVPLMDRVGRRWLQGEIDPAQEHLATATIRAFVGGFLGTPALPAAPGIVVTTPAGQIHELGTMLAAAMAVACGWRVVYLGPNLPAASIVGATRRSAASAVALGISIPEASPDLITELEAIAGALGGVSVIVGGRGGEKLSGLADRLGISVVGDLAEFRSLLQAQLG